MEEKTTSLRTDGATCGVCSARGSEKRNQRNQRTSRRKTKRETVVKVSTLTTTVCDMCVCEKERGKQNYSLGVAYAFCKITHLHFAFKLF